MISMGAMNFETELNREQLSAISAPDGPTLIIAAAGTGKTRTLTYRVAWLVCEKQIPPEQILLLTFTNKAANEMLDRARDLVGFSIGSLWGGTFHHLANRILRHHADLLGYGRDYTILDADDSKKLVKTCVSELELTDKNFPKPRVLLGLFGYASGTGTSVGDLAYERFNDSEVDPKEVERVWQRYRDRKKELNSMDFDDLLLQAIRLFRAHPEVRNKYASQFRYILVDEYQDTNTIQAEWIDILAGEHGNLMVVGDDFQSIYSWRGADYRNIINFPKKYQDAAVYKLETNYRSSPEIIEIANECIANVPNQFQKNMRSTHQSQQRPQVVNLHNGKKQGRYIVQKIRELRQRGVDLADIAVLYRSHYHALELQFELTRRRISFHVTSGMRFFEQAHIKDVCTILRLLANNGHELAFRRLLEMLPRVGTKTAQKIWVRLGKKFAAESGDAVESLRALLPKAARGGWQKIEPVFSAYLRESLEDDPGEVIYQFVKHFYEEYALENFDNYRSRKDDIDELIDFSAQFSDIETFLSEITLKSNLDVDDDEITENSLRLSTIHQAKGLEWKVVFLIWASDGMFPSKRSLSQRDGESEEQRLFYVATTRAEEELYYCVPKIRRMRDGGIIFYEASRFVKELPLDCVDLVEGDLY